MRFGVVVPPNAPFPVLATRWRRVEELGFDHLWVEDHSRDYRDPNGLWFDGWTVLAVMAFHTRRVRIGPLVSNPILRGPAVLAKAAATVDHLSGGRLELGIGSGIAPFDHAAMGVPYWPGPVRAARFAEYVEVVDGLLRSAGRPYAFAGDHYRTENLAMAPAPVQVPRPPITVGGQSPTALRIAARWGECWNTHGPFGKSPEEILDLTRRQMARLDELCAAAGRPPGAVRRSLLLFGPLDPWTADVDVETVFASFRDAGVREFIVFWPGDDRLGDLEELALDVLPALRAR